MSRLMSLSVPFVFVALSVASSSVVAYDVQPVDFKPKRAPNASRPSSGRGQADPAQRLLLRC